MPTRRPSGRPGGRPVRARVPGAVQAVARAAPRPVPGSLLGRPRAVVRGTTWRGRMAHVATDIPDALHAEVVALCLARGETFRRFVADALRRHVAELGKGG
jgi:hypothetical protein